MNIPKAFISYSHDTQDHKRWVLELATRLRNNGIDAILDQYELQPGDDVPHFMETHLASADKILMVCTDRYVEKANSGTGGVGYEKMIVTASLLERIDQNKVIPIIRQAGTNTVPTFLKSKLYINFSKNDDYESSYDDLVRAIHNAPLFEKPPVGNNPFKRVEQAKLDGDIELLHNIIKTINVRYTKNLNLYTHSIASDMSISRVLVEVGVIKLVELGCLVSRKDVMGIALELTDKGKLYAYENGLIG